ncbi:PEP-CTERM sorting domain-containing protein [[Empedobacter] haloabium]|uniref:PEP-CTERM sorting domain-containing protein n=1 Tax=[Empedobacter] haloabium TaxID=592317 RepID=A0ABZ1UI83_9BURK
MAITSNYDVPSSFEASAVQTFVVTVAPRSAFVLSGTSVMAGNAYGPNATNYSKHSLIVSFDNGDRNYLSRERIWEDGSFVNINESQAFALSFANTTDYAKDITVKFQAYAQGGVILVPEPSSYMMMGLGLLGLLGHARLRRKRGLST